MTDILATTAFRILQAFWSPGWLTFWLAILCPLILRNFESTTKGVKAPIVGQLPLEPYFVTDLRFKRWSMLQLSEGYNKVGAR